MLTADLRLIPKFHEEPIIRTTVKKLPIALRHDFGIYTYRKEKRLNFSGAVQSLLVGQRTKLRAPYYRYESLLKTQHEPPP